MTLRWPQRHNALFAQEQARCYYNGAREFAFYRLLDNDRNIARTFQVLAARWSRRARVAMGIE